jgi:hypothetical protein
MSKYVYSKNLFQKKVPKNLAHLFHKNPLYESCWILFGLPSGKNKSDTPNFKTLCKEKYLKHQN